ncbi:snaclec crotocetin-like isoform X3 [Xyrichtys novacula]|uniref:Snaclec crotocetin-like isoform X3 n=1 Tax=Xyrichtys novacula TaxID=13765 RepID=A0AAV1FQV0_XYRNO|nr:snaclec crotocetin-like isoform X3 [Xyrichtys novacula]
MEIEEEYVNSAARRKRRDTGRQTKKCCPGGSVVLRLVGVSFGLLCIVQATLNITLRLYSAELRPSCCPRGWQPYMSSCYRSSSDKGTWDDAQQDCEKLRAHLVVLDDAMEERVVHKFSTGMGMWIGLRKLKDPKTSTWDWTWVNGSPLAYTNWNQTYDGFWSFLFFNRNCAASPESSLTPAPWDRVNCENQNYWMCEKELNFSSFSP